MIQERYFQVPEAFKSLSPEQREVVNDIRIGYGAFYDMGRSLRQALEEKGSHLLYEQIEILHEQIQARLGRIMTDKGLTTKEIVSEIELTNEDYTRLIQAVEMAKQMTGIHAVPTLREYVVERSGGSEAAVRVIEMRRVLTEELEELNLFLKSIPVDLFDRVKDLHREAGTLYKKTVGLLDAASASQDDVTLLEGAEQSVLEFQAVKEEIISWVQDRNRGEGASVDDGANGEPTAEYRAAENEAESDRQFYRRWQKGDPSIFAKAGRWSAELPKVKNDIRLSLTVAGYSDAEIGDFFATTVEPWSKRVQYKRYNATDEYNWSHLRDEILEAVKERLTGREPDASKFTERYTLTDAEGDSSSLAGGEGEPGVVPDVTNDVPASAESDTPDIESQIHLYGQKILDVSDALEAIGKGDNAVLLQTRELWEKLQLVSQETDDFAKRQAEQKRYLALLDRIFPHLGKVVVKNEAGRLEEGWRVRSLQGDEVVVVYQSGKDGVSPIIKRVSLAELRSLNQESAMPGTPASPDSEATLKAEPIAEGEFEKAFALERQRYEDLKSRVLGDNFLHLMHQPNLERADRATRAVDELLSNSLYAPEKRQKKLEDQLALLLRINNELAESLGIVVATPVDTAGSQPKEVWADTEPMTIDLGRFNETLGGQVEPGALPIPDSLREGSSNTPLQSGNNEERKELGERLLAAKIEMRDFKQKYEEALSEHYRNRSFLAKLRDGARSFGGKEDLLPADVEALLQKFNTASDSYKNLFTEKLNLRSLREIGADKFSADGEFMNQAFEHNLIRKVFIDEQKEVESAIQEQAEGSRFNKIMSVVRKHPTAFRVLGFGVATGVGFAGGAALGAAAGGLRWAAATFGGAAVAEAVYRRDQQKVDTAEWALNKMVFGTPLANTEQNSVTERRRALREARAIVDKTKVRQRAKALGAALMVGAGAAGTAALADYAFAGDAAEVGTDSLLDHLANGQEFLKVDDVLIPHIEQNGTVFGLRVEDISLRTSAEEVLDVSDYPADLVERDIKLAIQDVLEAKPNLPKEEVARLALEKISRIYGDEDWWPQAQITEINIGDIVKIPADQSETAGVGMGEPTLNDDMMGSGSDPMNDNLMDEAAESAGPHTVTVESGDTLWGIVRKEYAETLKGLSPVEQDRALNALFDKVRADASLRDSIGLNPRAEGSIDKIWPNDKLNVKELGLELQKIIDNPEDLRVRPQTGGLKVSELDPFEQRVRILQAENANLPTADSLLEAQMRSEMSGFGPDGTEIEAAKPEAIAGGVPTPPEINVPSGEFIKDPAYVKYLADNGITEKLLEKGMKTMVVNFEGKTYSVVDEVFRGYNSPYETLSRMTIREINELRVDFAAPDNQGSGIYRGVNVEALREYAQANNFKEETLLAWSKQLDRMAANPYLPFNENTTLKDWVMRDVAQKMIEEKHYGLTGK